jgi:carbon-monoxide dehydrogenase medium subunit
LAEGKTGASMLQYFEPNFVGEALVLLDRFGDRARLFAGGTRVAFELRTPDHGLEALVNLKRIKELSRIEPAGDALFIGSLVTAATLESDDLVLDNCPLLARAARSMGAAQLRSVATLGGNLCSGDPASDLSAALMACDARCEVLRPEQPPRCVPIEDFLMRKPPLLEPAELLEGVTIARRPQCWSYQKMMTRHGFEMGLVAVAFSCQLDGQAIREPRLAVAGAAPTCVRAGSAEQAVAGATPSTRLIREAALLASERDVAPVDDVRASAAYRRHLAAVLCERAMLDAFGLTAAG